MKYVLIQDISSVETRTVIHAINLLDGYKYYRVSYDNLDNYQDYLLSGAIPIGSVEFVRKAINLANKQEPNISSYPLNLRTFLNRNIVLTTKKNLINISSGVFIKPKRLKLFNGFVYDCCLSLDESKPEYNKLLSLSDDVEIYVSEVVNFVAEYRYYIYNNEILGFGRYDSNDIFINSPNIQEIQYLVKCFDRKSPYSLDIGIHDKYETDFSLVEINDFWAIGLYENAISPKQYLNLLEIRYNEIFNQVNLDIV